MKNPRTVTPTQARVQKSIQLVFYLLAACMMFALKQHYSTASADQLLWMLRPVAWLVEGWDGSAYSWQPGVGFVRSDYFITIAPACAGINFFIMAYGLSIFAFMRHLSTLGRQAVWLFGALAGAYGLSVVVNALRIILTIVLYEHQAGWGWLTPERLHCATGIGVYFTGLGLYYAVLHRIILNSSRGTGSLNHLLLPWAWYIAGAVAVPVVHQLYRSHEWPAMEYCLMVIGISALLWAIFAAGTKIIRKEFHAPQNSNCGR